MFMVNSSMHFHPVSVKKQGTWATHNCLPLVYHRAVGVGWDSLPHPLFSLGLPCGWWGWGRGGVRMQACKSAVGGCKTAADS